MAIGNTNRRTMRVAVYCQGVAAHLRPHVSVVRELQAQGHEVMIFGPEKLRELAERVYDVPFTAAGPDWFAQGTVGDDTARVRLEEGNAAFNRKAFEELAGSTSAMVPDLRAVTEAFGADLIISEDSALAATVVGEVLGIPVMYSENGLMREVHDLWESTMREPYNEARIAAGLETEPAGEIPAPLRRIIVPTVPELLHQGIETGTYAAFQHVNPVVTKGRVIPDGVFDDPDAIPFYAMYGSTGANIPSWRGIFENSIRSTIAAAAEIEQQRQLELERDGRTDQPKVQGMISVGKENVHLYAEIGDATMDEIGLRAWPARDAPNVMIVANANQPAVLEYVKERDGFCLNHAGFGSLREILAAAVPTVWAPNQTDQPGNAEQMGRNDLGVVVADPQSATVAQFKAAIYEVIDRRAEFGANMDAINERIAQQPTLAQLVDRMGEAFELAQQMDDIPFKEAFEQQFDRLTAEWDGPAEGTLDGPQGPGDDLDGPDDPAGGAVGVPNPDGPDTTLDGGPGDAAAVPEPTEDEREQHDPDGTESDSGSDGGDASASESGDGAAPAQSDGGDASGSQQADSGDTAANESADDGDASAARQADSSDAANTSASESSDTAKESADSASESGDTASSAKSTDATGEDATPEGGRGDAAAAVPEPTEDELEQHDPDGTESDSVSTGGGASASESGDDDQSASQSEAGEASAPADSGDDDDTSLSQQADSSDTANASASESSDTDATGKDAPKDMTVDESPSDAAIGEPGDAAIEEPGEATKSDAAIEEPGEAAKSDPAKEPAETVKPVEVGPADMTDLVVDEPDSLDRQVVANDPVQGPDGSNPIEIDPDDFEGSQQLRQEALLAALEAPDRYYSDREIRPTWLPRDTDPADQPGGDGPAESSVDEGPAESSADDAPTEQPGGDATAESSVDDAPADDGPAEASVDDATLEQPGSDEPSEQPGDDGPAEASADDAPAEQPGDESTADGPAADGPADGEDEGPAPASAPEPDPTTGPDSSGPGEAAVPEPSQDGPASSVEDEQPGEVAQPGDEDEPGDDAVDELSLIAALVAMQIPASRPAGWPAAQATEPPAGKATDEPAGEAAEPAEPAEPAERPADVPVQGPVSPVSDDAPAQELAVIVDLFDGSAQPAPGGMKMLPEDEEFDDVSSTPAAPPSPLDDFPTPHERW